jgi:hypothetical protein
MASTSTPTGLPAQAELQQKCKSEDTMPPPTPKPTVARVAKKDELSSAVDAGADLPNTAMSMREICTFYPHHSRWPDFGERATRNKVRPTPPHPSRRSR